MAVKVQCPNPGCRKTSVVKDDSLGRTVYCPHCRHSFTLSESAIDGWATAQPDSMAEGTTLSPGGSPLCIGRFQVRTVLGEGAFGKVYRAYDPQLDREIALKVPRPGTLDQPQAVERFLREARAAARLRHPHIVPVYDAGQDGEHYYITAAFIEGRTLKDAMAEGRFHFRQAARVVRELAEALDYAHRQGIVHRDVKPANTMLDDKGEAHLMDFGLAFRHELAEKMTHEGAILVGL